jgi:hypothetical protein
MAERKSNAKAEKAEETSAQEAIDVETEQGFRGVEVDPTPNENYTLAGQNAGKPTPETDEDAAEEARLAGLKAEEAAKGVG